MFLNVYRLSASSQPGSTQVTRSDKELNRRINAGHSFSLPLFVRSSQVYRLCNLIQAARQEVDDETNMYSYGHAYICQVWGTSPNSFATGIHEENRIGKGVFFSLGETKLRHSHRLYNIILKK